MSHRFRCRVSIKQIKNKILIPMGDDSCKVKQQEMINFIGTRV